MIEQDTVRLLRECDAGVQMGMEAIDEVIGFVGAKDLEDRLSACRREHSQLDGEIQAQLHRFHDQGKDANPMARGMSWLKTNMRLSMHASDHTIADLMTDGCDMGVKSLSRYLNQYKAADERAKDIARRLITLEEDLGKGVRGYL